MTVSNFKELWIAIQDNGRVLTCWCCNHVIPSLYEKEYTNTHGYTDPSCTSSACALNKSTKKEMEPKRISDMVVRKRKILMIRMLRLENRQSSVHCKFCIWSFLKSAKLYTASVPITEKNPLVFRGSQRLWGGSSCQKWFSHWQGSWDIGISLTSLYNASRSSGFLRICMSFLRMSAVGLTFCTSCK